MYQRILCKYQPFKVLNKNRLLYHKYINPRFFSVMKVWPCPTPGEATKEIDILEWRIKKGDKVDALDLIGRAKYAKADYDLYAPYPGVINKIFVDVNQVAKCEEPLIEFIVDEKDSKSTSSSFTSSSSLTSSQLASKPLSSISSNIKNETDSFDKIITTPAVRKIGKDNNVDLSKIKGTGKAGRIMKEDVLNYLQNQSSNTNTINTIPITNTIPIIDKDKVQDKKIQTIIKLPKLLTQDYIENIIGVKRAMVHAMTEANKVPQFGYGDEINVDRLVHIRPLLKQISEKHGIKISYMPIIIKAISLALMNSPSLNAHINEEVNKLTYKSYHNIGIAVDSPSGLIVPNIKNVQNKSILEIAIDLDNLINKARNNKINNDDIINGTFTLSNIGAIGGTYCRPIVFVPQVCIGALGMIQKVPRYNNKHELYSANIMAISWSADHRVIDGATVARFSNEWKSYLENPEIMLLYLK